MSKDNTGMTFKWGSEGSLFRGSKGLWKTVGGGDRRLLREDSRQNYPWEGPQWEMTARWCAWETVNLETVVREDTRPCRTL